MSSPAADKVWALKSDKAAMRFSSDAGGKITQKQDRKGNTLAYTYTTGGKLDTITDVAGRVTDLDYNTDGLLSTITDMALREHTYTYATVGSHRNLREIRHADGTADETVTMFDYDLDQLMSVTNRRGHTSRIDNGDLEQWWSALVAATLLHVPIAHRNPAPPALESGPDSGIAIAPVLIDTDVAVPCAVRPRLLRGGRIPYDGSRTPRAAGGCMADKNVRPTGINPWECPFRKPLEGVLAGTYVRLGRAREAAGAGGDTASPGTATPHSLVAVHTMLGHYPRTAFSQSTHITGARVAGGAAGKSTTQGGGLVTDSASLGDIAEGMEVFGSDGALVGAVRLVWGGLTTLGSAIGADRATGGASPVGEDPEVSDLPSGTAPLGENAPGYIEVEALVARSPRTIYVPLSDVVEIEGGRLTLTRTAAEATSGTYDRSPSR